jgi:hypothetical protein
MCRSSQLLLRGTLDLVNYGSITACRGCVSNVTAQRRPTPSAPRAAVLRLAALGEFGPARRSLFQEMTAPQGGQRRPGRDQLRRRHAYDLGEIVDHVRLIGESGRIGNVRPACSLTPR